MAISVEKDVRSARLVWHSRGPRRARFFRVLGWRRSRLCPPGGRVQSREERTV